MIFTPRNEAEVQGLIRVEAMKVACQLWRNNVGVARTIDPKTFRPSQPIRYGLCNETPEQNKILKSSDLIGIQTITITPDMVGQQIGVFTSIEVKAPDWNPNKTLDAHETAQLAWINLVKSRGGKAGFANSVENALKILR